MQRPPPFQTLPYPPPKLRTRLNEKGRLLPTVYTGAFIILVTLSFRCGGIAAICTHAANGSGEQLIQAMVGTARKGRG